MPQDLTKEDLQTIYKPKFYKCTLHHLIPRSRRGGGSEFNQFPYYSKSHYAYHGLTINLKINQVWDELDLIHYSIFEFGKDYIIPWWLSGCKLENVTPEEAREFDVSKIRMLDQRVPVARLQAYWFTAFGSINLETSKKFLKLMMLFMIFGTELLNKDTIFNDDNLASFFEDKPCEKDRRWAFKICFGQIGTVDSLRSEIVSIVDGFDYYASVIL